MQVYAIPLTHAERALVRRAVEAYEPEKRDDDKRRKSVGPVSSPFR